MPTVPGMKSGGYYDRHSSVQRVTLVALADWIHDAAAELPSPEPPAPVTMADYGCSEGNNSILALGWAFEAVRRRRPEQPLCAVHTDLPVNNFNRLFANLYDRSASNYLQEHGHRRPGVFAFAAGGSFYEPLLPPGSVHFGLSFFALHWMDHVPEVPIPEHVFYLRAAEDVREAYRRQAADDLERFLHSRAQEFAPGGKLLLAMAGFDPQFRNAGAFDILNDASRDLVEEGQVDPAAYAAFAIPLYLRSVRELVAPLEDPQSAAHGTFTVDRIESLDSPIPFNEAFRRDGDAGAFAAAYTAFLRAWSEPLVTAKLAPPGNTAVVERFYERVAERLRREPTRYPFHNIVTAAVLRRTPSGVA